jgi:hypothetical protein
LAAGGARARQFGAIRIELGNLRLCRTAWWGWEKYDTAFMSMIYLSGEGELGALNVKANILGAPHRGSDSTTGGKRSRFIFRNFYSRRQVGSRGLEPLPTH